MATRSVSMALAMQLLKWYVYHAIPQKDAREEFPRLQLGLDICKLINQ
jgi:hypothetical protein